MFIGYAESSDCLRDASIIKVEKTFSRRLPATLAIIMLWSHGSIQNRAEATGCGLEHNKERNRPRRRWAEVRCLKVDVISLAEFATVRDEYSPNS